MRRVISAARGLWRNTAFLDGLIIFSYVVLPFLLTWLVLQFEFFTP